MIPLRLAIAWAVLAPWTASGQDWPQFLGPGGQGRAEVKGLPTTWSEGSANLAWKADITGLGWSSPVVQGERVWLTTAAEEGRSLRAICLDARTGRELHNLAVFDRPESSRVHSKNSHASPTPVIAGDRVFLHYGTYGTACLSIAAEQTPRILWRKQLAYQPVHGPGGSPLLFHDLLIVNCDGGDAAFVTALDAKTGEARWRADRPDNPDKKFAFSTPVAIDVDGTAQIVSAGAGSVMSYDPHTGREIWRVNYPGGYSVVPRPAFGHGMVFVSSGYDRPTLYAIRADGQGNVTETHVAWTLNRNAPHNPSPLLVGDELYVVSDHGVAMCVDARSGEVHWQQRLGGNFSASPVYGDGKIYFLNEAGATTVIAPGKKYQELAVNTLPGRTLATPALVQGAVFLRTDQHLYRIKK